MFSAISKINNENLNFIKNVTNSPNVGKDQGAISSISTSVLKTVDYPYKSEIFCLSKTYPQKFEKIQRGLYKYQMLFFQNVSLSVGSNSGIAFFKIEKSEKVPLQIVLYVSKNRDVYIKHLNKWNIEPIEKDSYIYIREEKIMPFLSLFLKKNTIIEKDLKVLRIFYATHRDIKSSL